MFISKKVLNNALTTLGVCYEGVAGNYDVLLSVGEMSLIIRASRGTNKNFESWLSGEIKIPAEPTLESRANIVCNYRTLVDALKYFVDEEFLHLVVNSETGTLFMACGKKMVNVKESVLTGMRAMAPSLLFTLPSRALVYEKYGDTKTRATWMFSMLAKDFCDNINKVIYVARPQKELSDFLNNRYFRMEMSDKGDVGFGCIDVRRYAEIIAEGAIINKTQYARVYDIDEKSKNYTGLYMIESGRYARNGFFVLGDTLKDLMPVFEHCSGELYLTDNINNVIIQAETEDFSIDFYLFSSKGYYPRPAGMQNIARSILLTMRREDLVTAMTEVGTPPTICLETSGNSLSLEGNDVQSNTVPCMASGLVGSENVKIEVVRDNFGIMVDNLDSEYVTIGMNDKTNAITIFADGYRQGLMPEDLKIFRNAKYYCNEEYYKYGKYNNTADTNNQVATVEKPFSDDLYYGEGGGTYDIVSSDDLVSPLKALERARARGEWM